MGENRNARDTNVKGRTECISYLHNNRLQEKTEDARNTNYQSITGENSKCARYQRNNQLRERTENARDTNVTIYYNRKQRMCEIRT